MRRLLCSSIADLKRLCLSMMCLSALSSPVRSSKAASSGCCFARSQSSKTPSCLVLLQSVKEQSRGRAARRLRDSIQAPSARASRSHISGRGPRRNRAAGRGGNDLHTLSFSSPKTTHALRGAVLTAPQRSETEDPEADPRHGRRVDGTFDEDGPHGGPFLLERANQIFYSLQEETFKAWSATPSS